MESAPGDRRALARELKAFQRNGRLSAKLARSPSPSADSLIRIIEQPETPTDILREALRLNGMAL